MAMLNQRKMNVVEITMLNQGQMKGVEWKKRPRDLTSEKERVNIHPYMNGTILLMFCTHLWTEIIVYRCIYFSIIPWQRTGICASRQNIHV
jgi:hypothetical protein